MSRKGEGAVASTASGSRPIAAGAGPPPISASAGSSPPAARAVSHGEGRHEPVFRRDLRRKPLAERGVRDPGRVRRSRRQPIPGPDSQAAPQARRGFASRCSMRRLQLDAACRSGTGAIRRRRRGSRTGRRQSRTLRDAESHVPLPRHLARPASARRRHSLPGLPRAHAVRGHRRDLRQLPAKRLDLPPDHTFTDDARQS